MKFSIITVCYNSAATLEQTIQSVLSQTYANIEYIIIDGGSSDGSIDIINKYKDRIAHFVSEADGGIYDAMNKGIALSTGDVVGILNSDDIYTGERVIEHLAAQFRAMEVDAICTDVVIFKDRPENKIRMYRCNRWKPWMFRIGHQPPHPGFYVKKAFYDAYGVFNTKYKTAADFDLLLRFIYKHRIKTAYLNFTSVLMRSGGASQRSFRALAKANMEDHLSLKENGYLSWYPLIWLKYALKIFQFRA